MIELDVLIVGAGPAGIGMALALDKQREIKYGIVEAGRIGESFRRWPAQTRFITPSFYSNPFGLADLNAVNETSSPALFAGEEHLSGEAYALYLAALSEQHDLPLTEQCKVTAVVRIDDGSFVVSTDHGDLHTRFLIWATGEFQFPDLQPFTGAEHCHHYAHVKRWDDFPIGQHTVIGGYESSLDAAINLVNAGSQVRVLARSQSWGPDSAADPSLSLSPYTRGRLNDALRSGNLEIVLGADVMAVDRRSSDDFHIIAGDGRAWNAFYPPILGTGFFKGGGARQIEEFWDWDDEGRIALTEVDESTRTPGLYLVGPQVRHDPVIYCFIYKFRQRFALIRAHIADQMGIDPDTPASDGDWGPFGNSDCCEDCQC
ncbi:NAD(P)/FAD-dependent oxidoreductase [Pseudomonas matsuisoli]|uniref:Monooxygenase n=1 Tax=Pseudomonas matsuisoli TaxID=1515666 RepID=A0A917PPF3_9PSED|nr:NAD(P)/FAD-dependent oxidoreductase [Pseudomonas matsuisoli]GGJ87130.1 monooxygenase [Pseudomonas matsuisoli]